MPRPAKPARLHKRPKRVDAQGKITQREAWVILDTVAGRRIEISTGCSANDYKGAERELDKYLAQKHLKKAAQGPRSPDQIPVADVLALYGQDIAPKHTRPKETAARIERLLAYWSDKTLAQVKGATCREYVTKRSTPTAARRELEDLRAAIYHHRREGLCSEVIEVVLPDKPEARDRWLERKEAAKLIRTAWRYREKQGGEKTDRATRKHVARYILIGLYTGTRAAAICSASFERGIGRSWIDLERGIFYRLAGGKKKTKKRQPPVPLPDRLLAHLRRWKRLGQNFPVEWNGKPVKDCDKAFRNTVRDAGLDDDVTPHTLRHTQATWQMQAGTDLWEAAGFLGMSVQTLENNYGHHHSKHLENARNAYKRHKNSARTPYETPTKRQNRA